MVKGDTSGHGKKLNRLSFLLQMCNLTKHTCDHFDTHILRLNRGEILHPGLKRGSCWKRFSRLLRYCTALALVICVFCHRLVHENPTISHLPLAFRQYPTLLTFDISDLSCEVPSSSVVKVLLLSLLQPADEETRFSVTPLRSFIHISLCPGLDATPRFQPVIIPRCPVVLI